MHMHKNPIFLGFLGILTLLALGYTGAALYKYYVYNVLSAEAPAAVTAWNVKEIRSKWPLIKYLTEDEYLVEARYSFVADGKTYQGDTIFTQERHRNSWSAEQTIAAMSKKPLTAWYNPRHPDHSTLQKYYPLKEYISAGVLWALLLYFIWLGIFVARYRT